MQIIEHISNQIYAGDKDVLSIEEQKKSRLNWLYSTYAYFIVYSFIGWVWETVVTSIDNGSLQKRGFLDVPILPIYGVAIAIIVTIFYNKGLSIPKIFFGSIAVTAIQEFVTSWTLEKLFHQVWWDYSHMRFQIQGRICLAASIVFGIASVIIVQFVHPKIEKKVNQFFQSEKSRMICRISAVVIAINIVVKCIVLLR